MPKVGPPSDKNVTILQHIKGLAREMDRRYQAILSEMDMRYQQRFEAQSSAIEAARLAAEKAISAALLAAEKAVSKAEVATEKRFEGVNEFRATLQDQATTFISRVEFEAMRDASAERIRELAQRLDKAEGRTGGLASGWSYLVGAFAILAVIVTIIIKLT